MSKILNHLNKIAKGMNASELKVGFIDKATYSDGTSVAEVAFTNEYGVPERNQPPRPFFRNAISSHQSEWRDLISRGLSAGKGPDAVLEVLGAVIVGDVKDSIAQLVDPALSPRTVALRKDKKHRDAVGKPVNNSNKPLIDTGVMLNDVNYTVGAPTNDAN